MRAICLFSASKSRDPRRATRVGGGRQSGALDVASSAPSRVRVPRVGALESPQPGLHSDVGRGKRTRDAAEKSWPEVRLFDAPLAGRARLPAKSFR